ncbi:hypothetical protein FHG89_14070 [Micromonospora orduensis]|uniref:Uncharacterized protein n=1 Tax=Micromonospora orduensis TaxID=1420891 RepID=A0A5C4QPM9_9ACTN|nr:hypothetical protein [Micromonospora orduensis]TNH28771.1 hypothetical protein FHG89_14070 [Micromonospora orduensis]
MCAQRSRADGVAKSYASDDHPPVVSTIAVTTIMILLMAFSLISWILGNITLAAIAGTAACTLAVDAARRLLDLKRRPHQIAGSALDMGPPMGEVGAGEAGRSDQ